MPIVLDNSNASVIDLKGNKSKIINKSISPKFFNSILTGKGGTSKGLLCDARDPKMYKSGYRNSLDPYLEAGTMWNNGTKIYNIPCYLIAPELWDCIAELKRPDILDMTCIASKKTEKIYLAMPLHAVQVEEIMTTYPGATTSTVSSRELSASMQEFIFSVKNNTIETHTLVDTLQGIDSSGNTYYQTIIYNMFHALRDLEATLTSKGYTVDKQALTDFLQNYSLYDELCKAAERFTDQTDYYIADVLAPNIAAFIKKNPNNDYLWSGDRRSVAEMLSRLEKYTIPLDQYQNMYQKLAAHLAPDVLNQICKYNLNLRLSNTLHHMDLNKANLQTCPCINHAPSKIPYSKEQQEAIESISPLTLVQSGAGTGKSTVILGRIDHMIANGIDPRDITVLSFTNAAANHINDLKPTIHSMTIAAMMHSIYSSNFPDHQLSSLATIINSLDIYFGGNASLTDVQREFIRQFKYILSRLQSNNEYTKANNFIEDNLDEVLKTLDIIKQTSLELESIICYQKMDTLIEPPEVQTKHLIIDEVQDNSISEFIYSIKYTDKHQCSMYIVGDCSQTLYEFRASNPKALNVLENSGVFETHKLQTNYRSNQEILDFANVLLGNIEANQYANIRLKANSLQTVTLQSFTNAVSFQYTRMLNKSANAYDNLYAHSIAIDLRDYIKDKLNNNEQICILAPQRRILAAAEKYIATAYPGTKVVSLVPKRQYDNAIFSKFIAGYWDTITYAPPVNITQTIRDQIVAKATYLSYRKLSQTFINSINNLMDSFEAKYLGTIQSWQTQIAMSVMTQAEMLDEIKKLMIDFEIKRNAVAQALMSEKNAEAKQNADVDNANFILSTIHSAKGLEFDNVIVYYQSESEATIEEASKRMYYVALTRAKKTEFIYAYDTIARPKIQGDYERILKTLSNNAANNANGTGSNDIDTDDSSKSENIVVKITGNNTQADNTDDSDDESATVDE